MTYRRWSQYVDNFVAIDSGKQAANEALSSIKAIMHALGLPTHDEAEASMHSELVVWELDCESCIIRPTRRRVWLVRLAVQQLGRRPCASSKTVERVVGHMNFTALIKRESLACFDHVYSYNRASHPENCRLPDAVLDELCMFTSLLPLLFVSCRASWSPEVYMCDASGRGRGVVSATCNCDRVKAAGAVSEKRRWGSDFIGHESVHFRSDHHDDSHIASSLDAMPHSYNPVHDSASGVQPRRSPKCPKTSSMLSGRSSVAVNGHVLRVKLSLRGAQLLGLLSTLLARASNHSQHHLTITDATAALFAVLEG